MTSDGGPMAGHLSTELEAAFGRPVAVEAVERLKGGYSRRMWAFEATAGALTTGWILCTDADDGVVGADSLSRSREASLLAYLHQLGLPVPAIAVTGTGPEPFGAAWFVMERLPGTAAVGPLLRDPEISARRPMLGRHKAEILARIHAVPMPADVFESVPTPGAIAAHERQRWSQALANTPKAATDIMAAALARMERSPPPPPAELCIVHGDYRTGNLLYDRDGITGVLDWEMAHPGDPLEDLAWAQLDAWRVGTGLVGAMLSDDDWIAAYHRASGRVVEVDPLRFWQLLTGVKMSILAWRAYDRTPAGKERDLLHALFSLLQTQLQQNLD
jgi:aminoglycoside phosphotransferase (APT) family kinase protein